MSHLVIKLHYKCEPYDIYNNDHIMKISKLFTSGMMIDDNINDDDYMGFYLHYKKSRTHATFSSFCPFFNYHMNFIYYKVSFLV